MTIVQRCVEEVEMLVFAAVPLTCWLCALLAIPRQPRLGDEAQELVYRRPVGQHQLLLACAVVATLAMALAGTLHVLSSGSLS